jgi:tetratricopeptide (TPR) repeat protein
MDELELKLEQADEYEAEGKFLFAVQIYTQLLADKIEERRVTLRLAHLYEKMNLYEKANILVQKYLEYHPGDSEVRNLFAQFLLRTKQHDSVLDLFEGIEIDESFPESYYFLGLASLESGKLKESKDLFSKYLKSKKGEKFRTNALFALTEISISLNLLDDALANVEILEKTNDANQGRVYYLFAKIYHLKGLNFYAQDSIIRSLKKDYVARDSYYLAGKIFMEVGEFEQAEDFLEKSMIENEPTPEVISLLGFVNINKQNLDKAQKFMTMALELNPYDETVLALKRTLLNY